MGTRGRSILGMDVDEVITLLKKAIADEWLAYYQYWLGAKIVSGPTKDAVIAELVQHSSDELRHAEMLSDRIVQLGGTPPLRPSDWYDLTNCGYDAPEDPFVQMVLEQNIKGEQCAITTYNELLGKVRGKDEITYNLVLQILQDEVEHEEDLQALLEDLQVILK